MTNGRERKSYWYYVPIAVVLLGGFLGGAALSFGVQYLGFFPFVRNEDARLAVTLFGMGVLGSTIYSCRFWARDIDEAVDDPDVLPHFFDFVGYITTILGGGVTGVLLYLVARLGIGVIATGSQVSISYPAALVLGFCGGLFHFRVENALYKLVGSILRGRDRQVDPTPNRRSRQGASPDNRSSASDPE